MYNIFIDPGHGGTEVGGASIGTLEKTLNLNVAEYLKDKLSQNSTMFNVKMSRDTDTDISIEQRAVDSNNFAADLFISIHHNSLNNLCTGYEVIHSIHGEKGKEFAEIVAKHFAEIGQRSDGLGVWKRESTENPGHDYYGVIRETNCPAIITEFCYMDNNEDYHKIATDEQQNQEANAIYNSILEFYEMGVKNMPEVPQEIIPIPTPISDSAGHWAYADFVKCNDYGLVIHDMKFDETITRGEIIHLFGEMIDMLKKIGLIK